MKIFLLRLVVGLGAILAPLAVRAADPAPKAEEKPAPPPDAANKTAAPAAGAAAAKDEDVLALPKIAVTATRAKELDHEIAKLDKAIAREKKNLKASDLDKVLNNPKLASAAAVFGGNSSSYMEEVAASRIRLMETQRDILTEMKAPRTTDELAMLKDELEKMRTMQREMDQLAH